MRKMTDTPQALLSQTDYRVLAEQAPIMIWRSGTDAKCDYFNRRWLEFTGRTIEQEMGDGWAKGVHADDIEKCLKIYLEAFERREIFEMEYRLRRHDGAYRWIFDRGAPITDENEAFAGYIGSCIDVTERVETQRELARAHAAALSALSGLLNVCAWCKKIRSDEGTWSDMEQFITKRSEMKYNHGMCPACERQS